MLRNATRFVARCGTVCSSTRDSAATHVAEATCSTSGREHQTASSLWQQQSRRWHGSTTAQSSESICVTFHDGKDGSEKTVQVPLGQSLLEAAHSNDIDLEGACEGSLACSTCHVIVEDQEKFDLLPEADDDENDMLDLAFALTDTSRLGCQIIAKPELDGLRVRIPSATRNFAVDGYVPKPH